MLQSPMNVTISNQCSSIELTSSTHLAKNATCYIQFPRQVDFRSKMKINFKIDMYQSIFDGILLCHLQRKENDESNNITAKDTAISTQLLVIWEFRIDRLYSYAWLIEHESTLIWSEDRLKKLYDEYVG
jgi:hypothetical protein